MLSRLYIRNYGLIDEINQSFEPGLNTITGETGAGKSMIIGALGLILGVRADAKVLRNPDEKCILEAEFIADNSVKTFFIKNNLDWDNPLLIRREITANGRSRAFVNDSPVKLELLKKLNAELIDIHTQEHTLKINSADYQLFLLDVYADSNSNLITYQKSFLAHENLTNDLKEFERQIELDKKEFDFLSFQFNELNTANFKAGELDGLEKERDLLANRESIKQSLEKAKYTINDSDNNVTDVLYSLAADFNHLKGISDWLKDYAERLDKVYQEIKDLGYEFTARVDDMGIENDGLEEIEQRLSTYYRLENKYNVKGDAALIKLRDELSAKLKKVENFEDDLKIKRKQVAKAYKDLILSGEKLFRYRKKAAPGFEKLIEKKLKLLGLNHPRIFFAFRKYETPGFSGLNHVELMFSSNPDSNPDRVELVASGGEKSRLMLVIKSILGHRLNIKSIVFDEIDSGISGEVAIRTGELLERLGDDTQVISITHLSQVAGRGKHQFKVTKKVIGGKTKIAISKLNKEQRVEELAEMISGKEITVSARKTAREILGY